MEITGNQRWMVSLIENFVSLHFDWVKTEEWSPKEWLEHTCTPWYEFYPCTALNGEVVWDKEQHLRDLFLWFCQAASVRGIQKLFTEVQQALVNDSENSLCHSKTFCLHVLLQYFYYMLLTWHHRISLFFFLSFSIQSIFNTKPDVYLKWSRNEDMLLKQNSMIGIFFSQLNP